MRRNFSFDADVRVGMLKPLDSLIPGLGMVSLPCDQMKGDAR